MSCFTTDNRSCQCQSAHDGANRYGPTGRVGFGSAGCWVASRADWWRRGGIVALDIVFEPETIEAAAARLNSLQFDIDSEAIEGWRVTAEPEPTNIPDFSSGALDAARLAPALVGVTTRYGFVEERPVIVTITFVWLED